LTLVAYKDFQHLYSSLWYIIDFGGL